VASCHWFPFSKALMTELKLTWLGLTSVPSPEIPETPPDSAGMIQLACSKALQQSGFGPCFEWIWSMFFFSCLFPKDDLGKVFHPFWGHPQPPGIPFKPPGQRQVTFFMAISWSKAKARCHCWLFSKLLITALNITTSGLKDSWIDHIDPSKLSVRHVYIIQYYTCLYIYIYNFTQKRCPSAWGILSIPSLHPYKSHGTKMIQLRVLSLEHSVHLQPIETSNSKRQPDH
jgi:hypothetical protein